MPFAGVREYLGTLRVRLTFWNSLVVFASILVALLGVQLSMRLALWHEADSQLAEDAQEIQRTIESLFPDDAQIFKELEIKADTHQHRELFIRLFDKQGRNLWSSKQAPAGIISPPSRKGLIHVSQAGNFRLTHVEVNQGNGPPWIVQVGATLTSVDQELTQLGRMLFFVGAISLIIAPLGGYWLAFRATQPLKQIMDTTARLHPSSLSERLPIRGTGDELERLSVTINGFLDRIARFLEQNREFTSNAAHELRSPLAAIQSSIEVALNVDRDVEEYKEFLADIIEQCAQLTKLVNQLLLLAESDNDRLDVTSEQCRFGALVKQACEMFQGAAEIRDVQLKFVQNETCSIPGDAARLRQVVHNLLDNALKFSPPGSEIKVELSQSPDHRFLVLTVQDQGAGIDPDDLPHIFERFYVGNRSRTKDANRRGTGLGLSICQSIVHAHGGDIHATSQLGSGTTIRVRLPTEAARDPGNVENLLDRPIR